MSIEVQLEPSPNDAGGSIPRRRSAAHASSQIHDLVTSRRAQRVRLFNEQLRKREEAIERFTAGMQPRDEVEEFLIRNVGKCTVDLEALRRSGDAQRQMHAEETAKRDRIEAGRLGQRLFFDPRGPLYMLEPARFSRPAAAESPEAKTDAENDPARLVENLESTVAGCQWLLDRWTEIRTNLDIGVTFGSTGLFKVARLRGRQPHDALDDPELAEIFLASHALDRRERNPFTALRSELRVDEIRRRLSRMRTSAPSAFQPQTTAQGRKRLISIAEQAMARLRSMADEHRRYAEMDEAKKAPETAFEQSPDWQVLKRRERQYERAISSGLASIRKIRRYADRQTRENQVPAQRSPARERRPPTKPKTPVQAGLI